MFVREVLDFGGHFMHAVIASNSLLSLWRSTTEGELFIHISLYFRPMSKPFAHEQIDPHRK